MPPVVHHVELCVRDGEATVKSLQKFGFYRHATRSTEMCRQWAMKLGGAVFVVTERQPSWIRGSGQQTPLTTLCCEDKDNHGDVDTVFNVAFRVKNVHGATSRIASNSGTVIHSPGQYRDEFGHVTYSVVRSCCGNVVHTLINKDDYRGFFLPGFEPVHLPVDSEDQDDWDRRVTHIDHVTLACYPGNSHNIISWYEKCFGMQRFSISRDDDDEDGLILEGGVGLRLKAMEYWRCAETGLTYPSSDKDRHPSGVMLVVVESLPGQTNCNVETFLKEHEGPGVEHIALSTSSILTTVSKMCQLEVSFRKPPAAYYNHIEKINQICQNGEELNALQEFGILLDSEDADSQEPKYLMQIFAHPLFNRKTFFIEVIQRCGAKGLGAGNILALVRSIRETEILKRKQEEVNHHHHSLLQES